jgi:ABC-2 type transport system permease protein
MSSNADALDDAAFATPRPEPGPHARIRPFYWSVWRELWENRAFYIAPLAAAGLTLFGVLISSAHLASHVREMANLGPEQQSDRLSIPYHIVAVAIIVVGLIVGVFYSLGALYNERRDRNILFWKSLPVSDLIAVLAKASLPMIVMPVITLAIAAATQIVILIWSTLVLGAGGVDATVLWTRIPLLENLGILAYGMAALALWYAPIHAWLLLVSAWARRNPFLWALLPPPAVCLVEKLAFNTGHFAGLLGYRLGGVFTLAFTDADPRAHAAGARLHADPIALLASPGLWTGLIFAAACLAGAVWLRRRREAI